MRGSAGAPSAVPAAASLGAAAAGAAPPAGVTVIRAGKFIDVEKGRDLENQIILVRGDKIEAVGAE